MEDETHYASAERTVQEQIVKEYNLVKSQKFFTEVLGVMTGIGAVINKNRQIIYANNEFLALLGVNTLEPILGKRPGEAVSCINSDIAPSGCGTSEACAYCGAVNAILDSQREGRKSMKETQISSIIDGKHKSWDLNVISTPISFGGEQYYVLILQDISDIKRRAALERIFFHDLLNSIGGLSGLLTLLNEESDHEKARELLDMSAEASQNIIEEILMHKQLRDAENGELKVNIELIDSDHMLDLSMSNIGFHKALRNRKIEKAADSVRVNFETDKVLLQRVLVNLLKNAIEATDSEGTVIAGVRENNDKIIFWVKNEKPMPDFVKMQMFHRSFSTKGDGRGIGTYSIRLLTENYLKGTVTFRSNDTEGTVFNIELNKLFPSIDSDGRNN